MGGLAQLSKEDVGTKFTTAPIVAAYKNNMQPCSSKNSQQHITAPRKGRTVPKNRTHLNHLGHRSDITASAFQRLLRACTHMHASIDVLSQGIFSFAVLAAKLVQASENELIVCHSNKLQQVVEDGAHGRKL